MTDRELLELAAKAAGFNITGWSKQGGDMVAVIDNARFWQPLIENGITDCDGDALRLAVKLQLTIHNDHIRSGTVDIQHDDEWMAKATNHADGEGVTEMDYSITRRAIVLAAAEIGKAMP